MVLITQESSATPSRAKKTHRCGQLTATLQSRLKSLGELLFYDSTCVSPVLMRRLTMISEAFTLQRCNIFLAAGSDMTESETESSVASQYSGIACPSSPALSVLSLSMSARDEMFVLRDGRTYAAADGTYPFPVFNTETPHCGQCYHRCDWQKAHNPTSQIIFITV